MAKNSVLTRIVGPGCQEPTCQRRHSSPGNLATASQRPSGLNADEGRVARQLPGQPAGGDLPHLDVLALPGRRGDPAAVGADRTLVEAPVGTEPGDFGRPGKIQDDGLVWGGVADRHVPARPVPSVMARKRPFVAPRNRGGPIRSPPSVSSPVARRGQMRGPGERGRVRRCEPSGLNWIVPTSPRGRCGDGRAGGRIPEPDAVDVGRGQEATVGAEVDGVWAPVLRPWRPVADHAVVQRGHSRPSASSQIPSEPRSRNATCRSSGPIRINPAGGDQVGAADRIPHPHRAVPGRGEQQAALMGELEVDHRSSDGLPGPTGAGRRPCPRRRSGGRCRWPRRAARRRARPLRTMSTSNVCDHTSFPLSMSISRSDPGRSVDGA